MGAPRAPEVVQNARYPSLRLRKMLLKDPITRGGAREAFTSDIWRQGRFTCWGLSAVGYDAERSWQLISEFGPGGVAQLVERLTGSQEVRGFESLRLHRCCHNYNIFPGQGTCLASVRRPRQMTMFEPLGKAPAGMSQ
jgi:hypothetical protein